MRCLVVVSFVLLLLPRLGFAEPVPFEPPDSAVRGQLTDHPRPILRSDRTLQGPLARRETAGPDTFVIYGGPERYPEGTFEDAAGSASWNGWTSYDATEQPNHWQVSTFNAANLGGHGEGNRAYWCGEAADDAPGWATPPGYGNDWWDVLLYESGPLDDPSAGQTVALDFVFNHDLEPGFDYFYVDYDSAGTWVNVLAVDGSSADGSGVFAAPGRRFTDVAHHPIVYTGGDYGGDEGDRIRIRLRVHTDGAYSDEDGRYDSVGGAVQLDDLSLQTSEGSFSEDFEGPGPWLVLPVRSAFAGDFAEIYPGLENIDPCRSNPTPVAGFIDYGQVVRNGPGTSGLVSTGGSTSPGVAYGLPGNWVTNYTGGLSLGVVSLHNGIVSPEIPWDLPGTGDDDPDVVGARLQFDVWQDLPLSNGLVFGFEVRSARAGEPMIEDWQWNTWWYFSTLPTWRPRSFDISELVDPLAERIQVRLFVRDVAWMFGWIPGGAGTPSPVFDSVRVSKHRIGGIALGASRAEIAQDGFPASGAIDVSSSNARDLLDVPLDIPRDLNFSGPSIVPGDSMVVNAVALIPGTAIADLRMVWALQKNPLFEDALRSAPTGWRHVNVDTSDPLVWTGEVLADTCRTPGGVAVADRFFFDLPDEDFFYPGDVLQVYARAEDTDGRVSTLPEDLGGFGRFDHTYTRIATFHALPSLRDAAGTHPPVLVVVETGDDDRLAELVTSMAELGLAEGVDYDVYWRGATGISSAPGGIGAAGTHGATLAQLAGYSTILYFSGYRGSGLSDGLAGRSDDLGLLEQWHARAGRRNMAYFGDRLAEHLMTMPAGVSYLNNTIGADYVASDVLPYIGGQVTPVVQAVDPRFGTDVLLNWNCQYDESDADQIGIIPHNYVVPEGGAVYGHQFVDVSTALPIAGPAASVLLANPRPGVSGYDVFFPTSLRWIYPRPERAPVGVSGRTILLQEILGLFGEEAGPGTVVNAPPPATLKLRVSPNPFNPRTVVHFDVGFGQRGRVQVYDLRGALVRTLHSGEFRQNEFVWDGTDRSGAPAASGVYLVRATADGTEQVVKVALVR